MVRAKKNIVSYVRELKPRKDTSRIEVRIVRLWRNYNKESGNTIEIVVVDKEGTRIHASVGEQLIKKFDDKLREGDAIVLQLFKVYDATGEYRTMPHPYKIGFFPTTFVGKTDDFPSAVPEKYFADFSDILGGNLDHNCLFILYINVKMMCTLWGFYAKQVLMLESAYDISSGSGGFTATPLSKRKSEQDDESYLEDQHSVNKKLSQKKLKGE
ncbi:hypothetical protein BRARA_A01688 [Brassica rapa]|uniref:Replication protein A 70 kDa DNA-binding subunit B/D first OB fold domain-containing protein n=1 Tax=Brassica campestris TaxID=3711 RepID=A0A398APX2_BRACM|nr:hypothetical protein BRARA_A01688 [Brassica rapa]